MYEQMPFNNMGMYGSPAQASMITYQTQQRPSMTQPLTNEEIAILTEKGGAFSTKVTQEDMLKAYCTHKRNGAIVATQNPDGSFTCPICGETFNSVDMSKESIEADVEKVIDDIQNIKLAYLDMPIDVARQYFPIIPLLRKLPQLSTIAASNWAKYDGSAMTTATAANSPYGYAAYNQMLSGQGMYPVMMGPVMGYPAMPAGTTMVGGGIPVNPGAAYVDPNANPMNPTGGYPMAGQAMAGGNGQPYIMYPNPQQTMMMTPAANEFVSPAPAGVAPTQPVNLGTPQPAAGMAPVTYSPQPAPNGNPTIPQATPPVQPTTPSPGSPEVDVKSFDI